MTNENVEDTSEEFNSVAMGFSLISIYLHAGVTPGLMEEFFHFMGEKKRGLEIPENLDEVFEQVKEQWEIFQNERFDH